jgi:plastocyanin
LSLTSRSHARLLLIVAAALTAAGCGGSTPAASDQPSATAFCEPVVGGGGQVVVDIKDFKYDPEPVHVSVGQTVTWTNEDSAPHSATFSGTPCTTPSLQKGQSGSISFSTAGTYAYFCVVHPAQMKAIVIVEP